MRPITAQHDGRCGICDGGITEGDSIVNVDNEWVHVQCAKDEGYEVDG